MTTPVSEGARRPQASAAEARPDLPAADPLSVVKGLAALRRLTGMYPPGHPMITQKLKELDDVVQRHLRNGPLVRIDIIGGDAHLDGVSSHQDGAAEAQAVRELTDLGVDSIHISKGVEPGELHALAEFLWQLKDGATSEPVDAQLAQRNIRHISLGKIVPLDTRWRTQQWPDAPTGPVDPAYAESLVLAEQTFDGVSSGRGLELATVRDLVQLLIFKVARSSAALGQILAVKLYENLTYCHSVNVSMLSLLLARQVGLDEQTTSTLVEGALLHDIGKTRVPIEILKKPGALDKRERKVMEAHTTFGAEILVEVEGLQPLTPTIALEHHRSVKGGGYPDVGDGVIPHFMSQIVSVADIYEAITGARSYQDPTLPEQACLILARLAGDKLNTALVKAFVNAITFFPLGSLVRTSRDETGVVIRTNATDPLHPVIALVAADMERAVGEIDTSTRDVSGTFERHIVETLRPSEGGLDMTKFLASAAA
jgi:putative nucleotidyltransferase with HDIG domain